MEINGSIARVTHVGTSRSGNPTYRVDLEDGRTYLTGTDAGVGYGIANYQPHRHWGQTALPVGLTLARGRIVAVDGPDAYDTYMEGTRS